MYCYDKLPKFARDWIKVHGVQAVDVYRKFLVLECDEELLRKWIAGAVIKNS